ncbi:MAG: PHB depolymerase family esterase [Acetobacteraceae bacterium]|nr:PHB depolymerase family esterase [Acetobacteraceae bacterium]
MPAAVQELLDRLGRGELPSFGDGGFSIPPSARPTREAPPPLPDGARFISAQFANGAGARPYKLFVPSGYRGDPVPLLVMLHGCTQSPDDFAAGTRMNELGEAQTFLVAYPGQTSAANHAKCWNWFDANHQRRDTGEPSIIAGITRAVMAEYAVDPRRVYVAGMSAGGAQAAIMGVTYPDLYAAIGVHSGLPCGSASDLPGAFTAMRQGGRGAAPSAEGAASRAARDVLPAIVFHGDRDNTVHCVNGDDIIAHAASVRPLRKRVEQGQAPGGHAYRRTLHADPGGETVLEQWVVQGAGHAWSGGSPAGSYTDPCGPDASREMVRFFMAHPMP